MGQTIKNKCKSLNPGSKDITFFKTKKSFYLEVRARNCQLSHFLNQEVYFIQKSVTNCQFFLIHSSFERNINHLMKSHRTPVWFLGMFFFYWSTFYPWPKLLLSSLLGLEPKNKQNTNNIQEKLLKITCTTTNVKWFISFNTFSLRILKMGPLVWPHF